MKGMVSQRKHRSPHLTQMAYTRKFRQTTRTEDEWDLSMHTHWREKTKCPKCDQEVQ